jgi:hypothetical protein
MWLLLTYFCKRPKVVIIEGISSCYRSCTDDERERGGERGGDGVRRAGESLRLPIYMGLQVVCGTAHSMYRTCISLRTASPLLLMSIFSRSSKHTMTCKAT